MVVPLMVRISLSFLCLSTGKKVAAPAHEYPLNSLPIDCLVQLAISDSGPGITTSDLPHVFERFFRADQVRLGSVEGAGLGLSIVQSICTAHGGLVKAENQADGGCRFIVQLPLAIATPPHLLVSANQFFTAASKGSTEPSGSRPRFDGAF
jgi:signal transduction histidine kinase